LTDVHCDRCGWPIHDTAYVCKVCSDHIAQDLADAARLAGEAWTTITRQARIGEPGGSGEHPMPFSWEAADATWAAGNTFTTWLRHATTERGRDLPPVGEPERGPLCRVGQWCHHHTCQRISSRAPEHLLAFTCRHLATQLEWLRYRREAAQAMDEIHDAARLVVRTVDNPPVRWYAGPCGHEGCAEDLYALPSASIVRCRECGTEHDADERRNWLLDLADDTLAHASLVAAALSALGHNVTSAQVRGYAHRGRLVAHGTDARGRPLYRVGEVRALAIDAERREAERRAKRGNLTDVA